MARNDRQFQPLGNVATPASWVLPPQLEIVPKAITAVYDGTSAGAAFLPTLEIVSDSGQLVARVPADTAVAAGGSAEVTFAPFLRAKSTALVPHTFQASIRAGSGLAMTGVPALISGWNFATSDADALAFDFLPPNPRQLSLLNLLYGYTFTVTVVWDAFAGNRTLIAGPTDAETAWPAPQSVTNGDAQQFITGYLRPYPATPTHFNVSLLQSTGVNQTWQSVEAVFQAVEFLV